MTEPTVYFDFSCRCCHCGQTVQYTDCRREPHPCPDDDAVLVIEGCNADTPLTERVEQSLDDYDRLTTTEETA